jgi:hypothetical protein
MIWQDTTSYAQGERGKIEPKAWTIRDGDASVTVVSGHVYNPGRWSMHCKALRIDAMDLGLSSDAPKEEAQARALRNAAERAAALASAFNRLAKT